MGKEWTCKMFGEIAPGAPDKRAEHLPFSVMNTVYLVGQFRSTDFHETSQKYVNQCPRESFCCKILTFSVNGSLFSKNCF